MAGQRIFSRTLISIVFFASSATGVLGLTCPGVPGFCSESHPGQTCVVVCDRGRNNVPLCQEDGTWTDFPRCVEHEPGREVQISGFCPGVSGYCSDSRIGQRCTFPCAVGPDVDSVCTSDGTWFPFPSCVDDVRETQDGCNPCDGPKGKPRNRPLETLLGLSPAQPAAKPIFPRRSDLLGKTVPTFAGEQTFGPTLARKERQHGGRPTIRYSYTAPSQSTYFIRHNSNSRQPPQPRKRNLVVATHPEEVVAAAVRRREQAQGRGRPAVAVAVADPTPTIEEIILDSPPPLAARKTSSSGFSVQSHPEEAVGSRSQGRPAPTAEVRLPQQEQQQQQQQRRRDDLFQSFFGSPLVRNSAQPRQRKEEEEREDSFLPNLRDLAVQRERPSPRRILNLPRDEPSLRLEPHPEEAVAAQEEILPPSIFADEVEEEELPEEGGEVRRVFNPQTGEYVEVVLTKKQLEREEAEKNKNKRPVPIYRGRFRVGPDGKLTAVPLDEIEEEPEIIETGEEVAPSAPEKDSHGPFELFQLGAASAAGRLSDEAFAVYDAAPGTQDELFDEEEEALIRQQQEKKHGLFDVVDLGR